MSGACSQTLNANAIRRQAASDDSLAPDAAGDVDLSCAIGACTAQRAVHWLRLTSGCWLGYCVSSVLHAASLWMLASWILASAPRGIETPLLVVQEEETQSDSFDEADTSQSASDSLAASNREPRIFVQETAVEFAAPQLAAAWLPAVGSDAAARGVAALQSLGNERGPRGPRVEFFGSSAYGQRFVFVLDASGSMNDGGRFQRAAEELVAALDALGDEQEFLVIAFNDRAWPMFHTPLEQSTLRPATKENKTRLRAWLSTVRPLGWTDPRAAMELALKLSPSAIFLLSDGEFKQGPPERKLGYATLRDVHRANRLRVPIHTLALEDEANAPVLRKLAAASGGTYRFVAAEDERNATYRANR